ncbi:MAG: rod shape-determining protein MreD [Cyanobacteria bacterium J06642_2]
MRISLSPRRRRVPSAPLVRGAATVISALAAALGTWVRLPGMVLAGVTPNWPLMWVVAWSVNRPIWQSAIAGVAVGLVQDGLTQAQPTHAISLALVGIATARLQKNRYVREDFVSVALIVFGMTAIAETILAVQWVLMMMWLENSHVFWESLSGIWQTYQSVTLSSAILSSLWTPLVYVPLNWIWHKPTGAQE